MLTLLQRGDLAMGQMKRLYVCNKAGTNGCRSSCHYYELHQCRAEGSSPFCIYVGKNIKCIRYRHPLEVAVIKEAWECRRNFMSYKKRNLGHLMVGEAFALNALRSVLKEGRK